MAAMAQPDKPVSPSDMVPSSGATQSLNFEPFQEVLFLRGYSPSCSIGLRRWGGITRAHVKTLAHIKSIERSGSS